jgi:hypothetical protein
MDRRLQPPQIQVYFGPDASLAADDECFGNPSVSGSSESVRACNVSTPDGSTCCAKQRVESIVHVIQTEVQTKRLALFRTDDSDPSCLVLRQQEWASGIGWFTQRSVEIEPKQLAPLRCALQQCDPRSSGASTAKLIPPAVVSRQGFRIVS